MYDLFIIDEARKELAHETAYSKKKWGPAHGEKYARDLQKNIRALKENPRLYPQRNDVLPDVRLKTFKGNRIIYTILEDQKRVVVLAILSSYQDIDAKKLEERRKQ